MTMKVRYTTINGEVIAEKRNGVRKQYVPDSLGSTVALLDNTQTQTDTFTYWPYGEVNNRTGTTATPFQFVGTLGYYANSGSRSYVRARELDSQKGRWLTEDPIGFFGGDWNYYRYTGNQPTAGTDPTGLFATPIFIGCNAAQKQKITQALNYVCGPLGAPFRACPSNSCSTQFPGGGTGGPDGGDVDPDHGLGSGGNISDCINGWCNTTNTPLTISCNTSRVSHNAPWGDCYGGCGATVPGKHKIVLCFRNIDAKKCDALECGIAHELMHECGIIGHGKGSFSCVTKIGNQCTKGKTVF